MLSVITLIWANELFRIACESQKLDQRRQLLRREMTYPTPVELVDRCIQLIDQAASRRGYFRRYLTAIFIVTRTDNQACLLHSIQQARDVRHPGQHPIAQLVSAESGRLGASQNSKHVVLRARNPVRLQEFLHGVGHRRRRSNDVQHRLFVEALERLVLTEIIPKRACHGMNVDVTTLSVKTL